MEPKPPRDGLIGWLPAVGEHFEAGVNRSGPSYLLGAEPLPSRTLRELVADLWCGLVRGWKGDL